MNSSDARPITFVFREQCPPKRYDEEKPMNSMDKVIEVYQRDVDLTLIDESLRRTPEERIRALQEFESFREQLHEAMEKRRDQI